MESSFVPAPAYDPYLILPFLGFRSEGSPRGELYYSVMHFIESEKFRGVDDSFRQFLLKQEDPEDFLLETGAIDHSTIRGDWAEHRSALIRAGIWMQLVQHQDVLRGSLLQPGCSSGIPLIDDAIASIYGRLDAASESGNELRRVVLTGDLTITEHAVFQTFDHLFQTRLPDEIYISDEPGLADLANQYALTRYIPVRVFPCSGDVDECAQMILAKATHVFSISQSADSDSELANRLLVLSAEKGKINHRLPWVT